MNFFNPESPLMRNLSLIADLMILNLAVMLFCVPVITAGAALTGMHYVLLRMVRNEEGYILKGFFKSFRENFFQATAIWCIFLLIAGFLFIDLSMTGGEEGAGIPISVIRGFLIIGAIFVFLVFLYAFPLLARYHNPVAVTLGNAVRLVLAAFPRTLGMAAVTAAMPLAVILFPPLLPVFLLAGLTAPGFLCALLYSPLFKKIENGT